MTHFGLKRSLGQARPLGLASVLLGLVACASTPPPEAPDLGVEVPEEWVAPAETPVTDADIIEAANANDPAQVTPVVQATWWQSFEDETLDRLVLEALASNRNLAAAADRVAEAAAQAVIAGADLKPQAGFGFDASRAQRNFIGFPIPGQEAKVLTTTTTSMSAGLNISWEIDLWGRLRAQGSAGLANLEAAEADFVGAQLSLAGQTAKAWFGVLEAQAQVDLARETLDNREVTSRYVRRRYELGLRNPLDLRLARTTEEGARAVLAVREQQLDGARRRVDLLLSRYPDGHLDSDTEAAQLPSLPPTVPAGLPSEIVTRRPDLQAAERRLAAAGLGVKQARASLYPQLRLTASGGRLSADIEDLLDDSFSVWSLAAGILQPIFQGGRLRAGVDLAEARYGAVTESYVQTVLTAFSEVETQLAAERFLSRQETALAAAAEQSVAAQRLAEQRYGSGGLADILLVLQSQRDAVLAQSSLLTVRRQLLDARVDLHLALGGDFES